MANIDEDLLKDYLARFFGYGNLEGDFWFIGMEEGGGNCEEEITSRLSVWNNANRPIFMDNYEFHKKVFENRFDCFFRMEQSKYQRTWGGLIKILLSFQNKRFPTIEEVKIFQSEKLGRSNSNNCIAEVFPLPSPNSIDFHYKDWTNIEFLKSRFEYKKHLKKDRIEILKNLISINRPKFVIFYSSNPEYIEYWSQISGIEFDKVENEEINKSKNGKRLTAKFKLHEQTCFVITHHPTYNGVNNEYLEKIAIRIRDFINC
jgi:hypothetical protein